MVLSGPTGTSSSSCQLRFMYPKRKLKEPSGFSSQPSYPGDTVWPLLYVSDCAAILLCDINTSRPIATAARDSRRTLVLSPRSRRRVRLRRSFRDHQAQWTANLNIVACQVELFTSFGHL